jgi:hypothetical protein
MFTPEQEKIYNGLKGIGESIANFYADAIRMIDPTCTLASKANLVAHLAREIDGGLKNVFAPTLIKESNLTLIKGVNGGHFASILAALGKTDPNNALAKEWHAIASNFHKIAHRQQVHMPSKDETQMLELWRKYEKVLASIIGSFLNITNRLDVLLGQPTPQEDLMPAIKNLVMESQNANYFFSRLDKESWLEELERSGFFSLDAAPVKPQGATVPEYWYPVKYLLNISSKPLGKEKDPLKDIVHRIMAAFSVGTIDLHPYVVSDIVQIVINLDNLSFGDIERKFLETYSRTRNRLAWSIIQGDLIEGLVKKLVEKSDRQGLLGLLDYIFGFSTFEENGMPIFGQDSDVLYVRRKEHVEKFYIGEFHRLHGAKAIELTGKDGIKVVASKLVDLDKMSAHSITLSSPPSIEVSSQSVYGQEWDDYLVYFVRDNALLLNPKDLSDLIDEFIHSEAQILARLAIHLIRERFADFSDKWWNYIASYKGGAPYIHEPYELLRQHSASFTSEQIQTVVEWIERINLHSENKMESTEDDYPAYRIRRWLTALHPSSEEGKAYLSVKTELYEDRNNWKMMEHPEFDSFGTSSFGHESPIKFVEFEVMNLEDQVEYIINFKPVHEFDTTEYGLAELLRNAVARDPDKYLYSLNAFLSFESRYVEALLGGLTGALQVGKMSDYLISLGFIEARLSNMESSEAGPEKNRSYKRGFASSVSGFINTVVDKSETLTVSREDADRMVDVLLDLLEMDARLERTEAIQSGYINHVLNSTRGRIFGALIEVVKLWSKIAVDANESSKWPKKVRDYFTSNLSVFTDANIEFSITLGMELPLLIHLDKEWVAEHMDRILDETNLQHFDYRFSSLFSKHYRPTRGLYEFYKGFDLFERALSYFVNDAGPLDTVMEFALFEWRFWQPTPKEKTIVFRVIEGRNPWQITAIVKAILQGHLFSDDDVVFVWDHLIPIFESIPDLANSYSTLLSFFNLFSVLDDKLYRLTRDTINKVKKGSVEVYSMLRHLFQIADTNIGLAGDLVVLIYHQKLVHRRDTNELEVFVDKLYNTGLIELADSICIAVGETGSLALKELYNKHN